MLLRLILVNGKSGDLAKICTQGFQQLKVKIDKNALDKICVEAVGLPIIVQQVCLQVMLERGWRLKGCFQEEYQEH